MEMEQIKSQQEQEKIKLQGMIDSQQLIKELQVKLQIAQGQQQTTLAVAGMNNGSE